MEMLVAIGIYFLFKNALAFLDYVKDCGCDQEKKATLWEEHVLMMKFYMVFDVLDTINDRWAKFIQAKKID